MSGDGGSGDETRIVLVSMLVVVLLNLVCAAGLFWVAFEIPARLRGLVP